MHGPTLRLEVTIPRTRSQSQGVTCGPSAAGELFAVRSIASDMLPLAELEEFVRADKHGYYVEALLLVVFGFSLPLIETEGKCVPVIQYFTHKRVFLATVPRCEVWHGATLIKKTRSWDGHSHDRVEIRRD